MTTATLAGPTTTGPATEPTEPPFQLGGVLTPRQREVLLARLNANRVQRLNGMSHLEAWDVRRVLIRVFGFGGWEDEIRSLDHVETIVIPPRNPNAHPLDTDGKPRYTVVYRCLMRLVVKDVNGLPICFYDDAAAGDATNQPSLGAAHDFAMKTAISQALKRCAVNLGDQFGLSLYNGGSADPVVNMSIVYDQPTGQTPATLPEDPPVKPEPGQPDPADPEPTVGPEPEDIPQTPPQESVEELLRRGRAALKTLAGNAGWSLEEIAADFYDWTKGQRIAALAPTKANLTLLRKYYTHKEREALAAQARTQDGVA